MERMGVRGTPLNVPAWVRCRASDSRFCKKTFIVRVHEFMLKS